MGEAKSQFDEHFDLNMDGVITSDEVSTVDIEAIMEQAAASLEQWDANGDQHISIEELERNPGGRGNDFDSPENPQEPGEGQGPGAPQGPGQGNGQPDPGQGPGGNQDPQGPVQGPGQGQQPQGPNGGIAEPQDPNQVRSPSQGWRPGSNGRGSDRGPQRPSNRPGRGR